MRRWRPKRLAGIFAVLAFVLNLLDWVVGKIGYLGIFTSPEDLQTAETRLKQVLPAWLYDTLALALSAIGAGLGAMWRALSWVWGVAKTDVVFWILLALAFALILYDAPRVTRLRHRARFRWRRALAEQVWISRESALTVIKESPWGRIKEPNVVRTVSTFDAWANAFTKERVVYGMSDTQKALLKYDLFLDRTLDGFCAANPTSCRDGENGHEVEEVALLEFIKRATDDEIGSEFGEVPSYKVT